MNDYISNGEVRDYDLNDPKDRRDFFLYIADWWAEVKSMKEIDYSSDPPLERERKFLVEWANKLRDEILADPAIRELLDEYRFKLEAGAGVVAKSVLRVIEGVGNWVDRALDFSSQETQSKEKNKVSKLRVVKKIGLLGVQGFAQYKVAEKAATIGALFLALYFIRKFSE